MNPSVPTRRFSLVLSVIFAAVVALVALSGAAPASADTHNILTWKLSQHSWTSSSLSPAHQAGAPATKDPANGWVFPLGAAPIYNPSTGAMYLEFDGSLTLGNFNQGGYRIVLANPSITVNADDSGFVKADVSYCASTADCISPGLSAPVNAKITTFNLPDASVTDDGVHTSFTVTPFWATVGNQFHQEFLNALPASLQPHFRATGSASDANKPPAPLSVEFDFFNAVGGDVTLAVNGDTSSSISTGLLALGAIAIVGLGAGAVIVRRRLR